MGDINKFITMCFKKIRLICATYSLKLYPDNAVDLRIVGLSK